MVFHIVLCFYAQLKYMMHCICIASAFVHSMFLCTVIFVAWVVDLSIIISLFMLYDGLANEFHNIFQLPLYSAFINPKQVILS